MTDREQSPEVPARERILTAAEELFAEHGYDRTSTARLARAAGVPQGLIFYHFGTKEGLLLTLVRERSSTALAGLLPRAPGSDLHEAVAELWRHLRAHLGTPTPMQRIMMREVDTHPELREHARQILTDIAEQLARHLADLVGNTDPPAPEQLAAARMLTVTAALTQAYVGFDFDPDAVAGLLLHGLAGPSGQI